MHMFGGRLVFLNLMPSQTARPTITNEQGQYWSETAFFSKRFWFCKKDPSETLPGHRHWRSDRLDFSKLQSHYIKRLVNCDWAVKAGLYEMEIESQWRLYSQAGTSSSKKLVLKSTLCAGWISRLCSAVSHEGALDSLWDKFLGENMRTWEHFNVIVLRTFVHWNMCTYHTITARSQPPGVISRISRSSHRQRR